MSRRLVALFGTALLLVGSRASAAQTISVIPLLGTSLTITSATPGQDPNAVSTSGGTYTVTLKKNQGIGSITARLSAPLPAGTTLTVTLQNPGGGGQSAGAVTLTTTAQPVVINLPNSNTTFLNKSITYTFDATAAAGVVSTTAQVIFAFGP